jgi:hypothetical protein
MLVMKRKWNWLRGKTILADIFPEPGMVEHVGEAAPVADDKLLEWLDMVLDNQHWSMGPWRSR